MEDADDQENCVCLTDSVDADIEIDTNENSIESAEEEENDEISLEDPQEKLRELCENKKACQVYRSELNTCEERVNSRQHTEEHCTQELFDFLHCTDECIAEKLFKYLK